MSDRVSFLLKYGRAEDIRNVVNSYKQHGIDNSEWAIHTALKNPACPTDIVDHAATKGYSSMKADAFKHPNLSPEVHTKALNSSDPTMRLNAWHSHHTTIEQLQHAAEHDPGQWGPSNARHILKARLAGVKPFQ
jgi:hypothetical protein